jgi:hypothetical protein
MIAGIAGPAARHEALDDAAHAAAAEIRAMDFANPSPRGEPVDSIRRETIRDQSRAAALVEQQPAGYARARAWLAMAKALLAVPSQLPGNEPPDGPGDGADELTQSPPGEPPLPAPDGDEHATQEKPKTE